MAGSIIKNTFKEILISYCIAKILKVFLYCCQYNLTAQKYLSHNPICVDTSDSCLISKLSELSISRTNMNDLGKLRSRVTLCDWQILSGQNWTIETSYHKFSVI